MVQNEEDDNSSIKSQENVGQNDNNFNNTEDDISFIDESKVIVGKQQIDELNDLLQKEMGMFFLSMNKFQYLKFLHFYI